VENRLMPKTITGLDIGRHAVKAVQVSTGLKSGFRITAATVVPVDESGGVPEALRRLLDNQCFKGTTWITSLPVKSFSFRNVKLPFKEKKKIKQTLPFELEPLIPYPIQDVLVDYLIVDQSDGSEILAAAIPESEFGAFIRLLDEGQIEVSSIDIDTLAIVPKLAVSEAALGLYMLLDIGARESTAVFMKNGGILQVRSFSFGGDLITEIIATTLTIEFDEAERKKRDGEVYEARDGVEILSRKFIADLETTLKALKLSGRLDEDLAGIFLTGGGAIYKAIRDRLIQNFPVPIHLVDMASLAGVQPGAFEKDDWNPLILNQALALAVRQSGKEKVFNFSPVKGGTIGRNFPLQLKKDFRWVAASFLLILVLAGIDLYLDYHYDRIRLNRLKNEVLSLFMTNVPDAARVVDPVQQLRTKITEARRFALSSRMGDEDISALKILKEISEIAPGSSEMIIKALTYDGNTLEIKAEANGFDAADRVKEELAKSKYLKNLTIGSSSLNRERNRVEFDLKTVISKKI
jgi:general secretion pathway protein L